MNLRPYEQQSFLFGAARIRVTPDDLGNPWWYAAEVCAVLDIANPRDAMGRLDADEKSTVASTDGGPERNIINESGLYTLILGSRKAEARVFKRWVTGTVLPSIRRTGQYTAPSAPQGQVVPFQVPKTLAQALRLAADQAEQLEHQAATIQVLQPKAAFHDAVHDGQGAQSIREVAQVLGTGQNRLFAWLRGQRILLENNLPYQEHLDAGRFRVVESTWTDRDGCTHPVTKTLVTGKGLTWLQGKWQAWKNGDGQKHAEVG